MHKLYCKEEELSTNQRYLLQLCEKRELAKFWADNFENKYTFSYIFYVAIGKFKYPSIKFIIDSIKILPPEYWFKYDDIDITKIENNKNYISSLDDLENTINYNKIIELIKKREIKQLADKYNLNCTLFYHIHTKRNNISPKKIFELKDIFDIKNWFIKE